MSQMPTPDFDATIDFLTGYAGDDPIVLTAIVPDGGGVGSRTFKPASEADRIRSWLERLSGRANLYFTVNACRTALDGRGAKAKKIDIRAMKALHVDIDPRAGEDLFEERERAVRLLQNYDPPASIIIDSGNGFQGFWLLDEEQPLDGSEEQTARLEGFNQHIASILYADACQNIDRVMRLPGTINLPGKTKLAKGRVPVLASVFSADWQARYSLDRFKSSARRPKPPKVVARPKAPSSDILAASDLGALPKGVSDVCKKIIVHGHDPDDPDRLPSRSEWLFRVCCELIRAGAADETIHAIITDRDFGISESVLEKRNSDEYARQQIASARLKAGEARATNRPVVMLKESELHRVLDEVEVALIEMAAPIYQMSGRLVHVERRDTATVAPEAGGPSGALVINDVSDHRLREYMIEHVEFRRPDDDEDEKGPRQAAPTLAHAKHLRARSDKWRLRTLRGIVEAPTLRADGSVLVTEGYDDRSGYVVDFGGVSFPPIPDTPSREDARAALALLTGPLAGFPFVVDTDVVPAGSSSRSVALSAILTALCRRSLRAAPMHAFTAPTMATGKSMLADVVSLIAIGRTAVMTSQGNTEEEDEKRLLAMLMQGDPIIVIDNVERPISGSALCSILTQEHWQSRLLGMSRQIQVPTNVLFVATGNNISFRDDMSTRAIVARLDAGIEAPETRVFVGDLRKEVRRQRPLLVAAGLTILRAFCVAGRPGLADLERYGRFEEWSDTVRGALVWLGEADPCLSRAFVAQRDIARDEHSELMQAWLQEFGVGEVVRAAEIIQRANPDGNPALKEALDGICPVGPTPKRLGRYLAKIDGRRLNGLCIEQIPNQKQGARYRLKSEASANPPRQEALVF